MTGKKSSRLAEVRKNKGLTQEELADKAGVTVRTIQRIENGQVHPQIYTLRTLAACLDTTVEELIGAEGASAVTGEDADVKKDAPVNKALLAMIHVLPLFGIYLPLLNVAIPLIFWMVKRDENEVYHRQGVRVLNFQIGMTLLAGLAIALMLLHTPVGLPLLMFTYAVAIIMAGWNMVRILNDKEARYPGSIRFVKE